MRAVLLTSAICILDGQSQKQIVTLLNFATQSRHVLIAASASVFMNTNLPYALTSVKLRLTKTTLERLDIAKLTLQLFDGIIKK